ncbi:MAG: RNA polymerase sigma factor [Nannocystaceae bacterium]|nr:sigma-70 family RNA polymerase sigma factor [bacterium]
MTSVAAAPPLVIPRCTDVVRRAQAGDVAAFEQLYREHVGTVLRLCWRLCGGRDDDAHGLTQEVFVRAWERLAGFRGDAAFGTWLHRLAINVVLGERRSAQRRELREQRAAGQTEVGPPQTRVDAGVDLDKAIAALPERARMVFVLHAIEGYAHAEIAEVMGSSVGTTKAQLHRARALLREALS